MSPSPQLDGGSDLSELSDAGSQPGTPGQAITPQTSPVPQTRRASLRSRGNDESNLTTLAVKSNGSGENVEQNHQRPLRSRNSYGENAQMKGRTGTGNTTTQQQESNAKSNKKAPSQQKWEYKEMLDKNIFQEDPLIEGKRARKSVERYGNEANGAESKQPSLRRRSSSSRKSASREPSDETSTKQTRNSAIKSPSISVVEPELAENRPQQSFSKKIKIKRKPKAEVSHTETEHDAAQEDSDEEQPTRKRRKGSTLDNDGPSTDPVEPQRIIREREKGRDEDDDDLPRPKKNKKEKRKKFIKLKKRTSEKKKEAEPISDEYEEEHITDSDVAMSDDADDDAFDESRDEEKVSIEDEDSSERHRPNVKSIQRTSLNTKPNKSRTSSSNIVPAKDLAASIHQSQETPLAKPINTGPSNLAPSSVKSTPPQRPPVPQKTVIRKSVGSSVLDNLMGFGTPSRSGPPRPRPMPPNATSSPQTQQLKRPGEPVRPRPSINDPTSREKETEKSTTSDSSNLGLVGKHITQEQMTAKREKEVEQYANPKGLFNLLEGTELMMEFEDETRQRLQIDPFLHKHKLYRPGRTEGMWKLIERIKETEGLNQAAV